jgi:hypothetical protein
MANPKQDQRVKLLACLFLAALAPTAGAANLSYNRSFTSDDDVVVWGFRIATARTVTLETVSFSGGFDVNGQPVPAGGFDPVLTLFDGSGLIIDQNDDGPIPGDSQLIAPNLAPGFYFLVLSQFDNFPIGPFLSDGFTRQGQANFTGSVCGVPGGSFLTINTCEQRSASWALNVRDVDTAAVVPEPSTAFLALMGLVACAAIQKRRRNRRTTSVIAG